MVSFFLSYFKQKVDYHSSSCKVFAHGPLFLLSQCPDTQLYEHCGLSLPGGCYLGAPSLLFKCMALGFRKKNDVIPVPRHTTVQALRFRPTKGILSQCSFLVIQVYNTKIQLSMQSHQKYLFQVKPACFYDYRLGVLTYNQHSWILVSSTGVIPVFDILYLPYYNIKSLYSCVSKHWHEIILVGVALKIQCLYGYVLSYLDNIFLLGTNYPYLIFVQLCLSDISKLVSYSTMTEEVRTVISQAVGWQDSTGIFFFVEG
ncbi:hypothetical protein CCY16_00836 [Wolbachia endosymbiont of Wuchereria bancrofti]|nr:hypothetical protein CCY16_00836 [Wolbachia endosymbiont of Wuchereria bancrofti]